MPRKRRQLNSIDPSRYLRRLQTAEAPAGGKGPKLAGQSGGGITLSLDGQLGGTSRRRRDPSPGTAPVHVSEDLSRVIDRLFAGRILAFDRAAADQFPEIVTAARKRGFAISFADTQIAAIAAAHGFTVATRDTGPFLAGGILVIDPWE